jgi:hypothetical protein
MLDRDSEERRTSPTSDSDGEADPDDGGDDDDVIYVDLTRDPESQNWLDSPAEKRQSLRERSETEKRSLKHRFQDKLERLNR